MFGSEALEVAIGVILLYLILALVTTVVVEWISRILAMRSNTLLAGIKSLLSGSLADEFYSHPLIKSYGRPGRIPNPFDGEGRPSYIPSHLFVTTLLDVLPKSGNSATNTLPEIRAAVGKLTDDNKDVKRALQPLVDQAKTVEAAWESLEKWFDNAMDRVSGQYARKAQLITIIVSFVLAIFLNADTLVVADALNRDPQLRESVNALAAAVVENPEFQGCLGSPTPTPSPTPTEEVVETGSPEAGGNITAETPAPTPTPNPCDAAAVTHLEGQIADLGLPLGWVKVNWKDADHDGNHDRSDWLYKVLGLLLTGFAVSLGAPFWFDTLQRFVNIRSVGAKPEKSKDEKSTDQASTGT